MRAVVGTQKPDLVSHELAGDTSKRMFFMPRVPCKRFHLAAEVHDSLEEACGGQHLAQAPLDD